MAGKVIKINSGNSIANLKKIPIIYNLWVIYIKELDEVRDRGPSQCREKHII